MPMKESQRPTQKERAIQSDDKRLQKRQNRYDHYEVDQQIYKENSGLPVLFYGSEGAGSKRDLREGEYQYSRCKRGGPADGSLIPLTG